MINRFCEVLYLSFERRPFALLTFFFRMFIYTDHVRCSSNIRPRYLVFVLGVIFWPLIESSHFLLFSFFLVEKLLFLFYPHSVRSCLLEDSVQSVVNHGSRICLFVLESCLSVGDWCHL